ncbi:hypothetical protein AYI68_g5622 [Smittium mucronatum]|uniref:Uncharacterized protein n=1 Tax=Smittium mucronatum TaxID=133383 RepID=A0A1R0GTS8_9FUNG|nr:hypothetical protein AYI68_g5622 [Smittium mucronatum]
MHAFTPILYNIPISNLSIRVLLGLCSSRSNETYLRGTPGCRTVPRLYRFASEFGLLLARSVSPQRFITLYPLYNFFNSNKGLNFLNPFGRLPPMVDVDRYSDKYFTTETKKQLATMLVDDKDILKALDAKEESDGGDTSQVEEEQDAAWDEEDEEENDYADNYFDNGEADDIDNDG